MYEQFFGLSRKPFELQPDPSFMYLASRHVSALKMLEYGLFNHDGFAVITGEVGCGKTTVIKYLVERLGDDVTVGVVPNTHKAFGNVMQWALIAFGLDYKKTTLAELYETFERFIIAEHERGKRVLLIIDEAQNLGANSLEVLRLLSNITANGKHVLHTALVGQPELRRLLQQPNMRQVRQRIAVAFHLTPLTEVETSHYMTRRLEVCGATLSLFEAGAASLIHMHSGGIPRLINVICDAALVYAFGERKKTVSLKTIRHVIADRKATGVMPVMTRKPAPSTTLA
jgi:type II secretory pathway predicted ATPase ExeA